MKRGERDGVVHELVINPWRNVWSPLCRRAQLVRGLQISDADVDCPACLQLRRHQLDFGPRLKG